jgi:hypothetical protein
MPTSTIITSIDDGSEIFSSSSSADNNVVNANNEKQNKDTTTASVNTSDDRMNLNHIEKEQIGNKIDEKYDMKIHNRSSGSSISSSKHRTTFKNSKKHVSAIANNTLNGYEIERFISEHKRYQSNNITVKKSWGK